MSIQNTEYLITNSFRILKEMLEDRKIDNRFVDKSGTKMLIINNDPYNDVLNDLDILSID